MLLEPWKNAENKDKKSTVIFHCPNCRQKYKLSDEYIGHKAECLSCGCKFFIPAPNSSDVQSETESKATVFQAGEADEGFKKSVIRIGIKKSKSDLLLSIMSFFCCIAACSGILYSTEVEFFLPSVIFLLLSLFLSLADIYKKRLFPGLLILIASLAVPGYVFPQKILTGFSKISGMIQSLAKDDGEVKRPSKDKSFWEKSLFDEATKDGSVPDKERSKRHIEPITGAFGRKLGEEFACGAADNVKHIATGEILYQFTPDKPFRKFSKYYLLITPASKKVYAIWAETGLMSASEAEREFKVLIAMLERRYRRKSVSGVIPSLDRRELRISGRSIYLMSSSTGKVKLRYVDDDLEELAEQEAVMREAGKTDASSL